MNRNINTSVLFGVLILLVCSCRKPNFRTITETDEHGVVYAGEDTKDWQLDYFDEPPRKIREAFDQLECEDVIASTFHFDAVIRPAYPNPFKGIVNMEVEAVGHTVKVVVVAWNNKIVFSDCFGAEDEVTRISIDFDELSLKSRKYYRIYYEVSLLGALPSYGHGDVRYE